MLEQLGTSAVATCSSPPLTLSSPGKQPYLRVIEEGFPELAGRHRALYSKHYSPPRGYTRRLHKKVREVREKARGKVLH